MKHVARGFKSGLLWPITARAAGYKLWLPLNGIVGVACLYRTEYGAAALNRLSCIIVLFTLWKTRR